MPDHGQKRRRRLRACLAGVALIIALAATGCSANSEATAPITPAQASKFAQLGGIVGLNAWQPPLFGLPQDPFAGTPADAWSNGTAGIVLPQAQPMGHFSAGQVESAYKTTSSLLAAAYLDQKTLLGGQPTAFADLLSGQQRTWFLDNLNKKGVNKDGLPLSTRAQVMAFPPGGAQLFGGAVKVNGKMSATLASYRDQPMLVVHADYIFVYAIEPPGYPAKWMRVIPEAKWTVMFGNWAGSPWVSVVSSGVAGAKCGTGDGYVHPNYPAAAKAAPSLSASQAAKQVNPYVLGARTEGTASCWATTAT
jgi:hypothetical protein